MRQKIFTVIGSIILLAVACFIWYGIATDCPDTAGYVYCPKERSDE